MRYCLECRRISADGPLCTSCGRSFGGRLCNARRRHLNPPGANVCGQCGSTTLTDPAAYIPLSWLTRSIVLGGLALVLLWLLPSVMGWAGGSFQGVTGYRSPLVWLIEICGRLLTVFFVFYLLSAFIPGEAGKLLRGFITNLGNQILKHGFALLQKGIVAIFNGLIALVGGTKTKP